MNTIEIDIARECDKWPQDIEELTKRTVDKTLKRSLPKAFGEISIVLANDTFIRKLNKDFRGKDKPTNVLSFPQLDREELAGAKGYLSLGDVILSYETIYREAKEQNKSFYDHTTHMLVHGTLHILGHDHIIDSEAEEMEALEIKILEALDVKNPYESAPNMA
ncbi:MAG: rRNA maturation RNase YbeY [Micavibrio sp.]|nr:rRNA maturation RNase YbeY [Micavibrio sp.]